MGLDLVATNSTTATKDIGKVMLEMTMLKLEAVLVHQICAQRRLGKARQQCNAKPPLAGLVDVVSTYGSLKSGLYSAISALNGGNEARICTVASRPLEPASGLATARSARIGGASSTENAKRMMTHLAI